MGACGPCFSRMPIGRINVAADFSIARGQSPAVSSSQRAGRSWPAAGTARNAAAHRQATLLVIRASLP